MTVAWTLHDYCTMLHDFAEVKGLNNKRQTPRISRTTIALEVLMNPKSAFDYCSCLHWFGTTIQKGKQLLKNLKSHSSFLKRIKNFDIH